MRELHAAEGGAPARAVRRRGAASGPPSRGAPRTSATPAFLGRRVLDDVPLDELVPYIDWRFFFTAWELPAEFPQILDDPTYGEAARDLYGAGAGAARAHRAREAAAARAACTASGRRRATATTSCSTPTQSRARGARAASRCCASRAERERRAVLALADFVAPRERGLADHVGAFAVTAGLGLDELVAAASRREHDDYSAIIAKALADRLAEAFAECLHERARREWYAAGRAARPGRRC